MGARVRAVGWLSSLANLRVCVIFLAKRTGGAVGRDGDGDGDGGRLTMVNML